MCCNGVRAIALVVLLLGLPRAHAALCPETVVIGYPAGRWPIAALGQDGPDGISAGYLQQLSAHGVTFSLRPLHGSAGAAAADGLQGLIGWPRTEVPHGWLASQPYLQLPQVIVRRRDAVPLIDLGGLHGQRVATLAPNTLAGPLHAQARGAHLLPMADIDRALDLLDSGTVDAVVANLAEAEAGLRRRGDDRLHVAAPAGLDSSFVLAAPPACASLVHAFNDLLQAMPAQQQLALLQAGRTPSAARIAAETPLLRGAAVAVLVLLGVALLQALGFWRLHREASGRRRLQQRLDEITANLPAVVFQAFRPPAGPLHFPFIAGDVQALFGISTEAALLDPRLLLRAVHGDDLAGVRASVGHATLTATPLDVEFRTLTGRWVRAHSLPCAARDGSVYWQGCWIDVSEHHELADALHVARGQAEHDAAAKSHFLASMGQQIRTPMASLLGLLEQLSNSRLDGRQQQVLATVEDAADVLRQVLDDVLDAPQASAGPVLLQPVPTDLDALLRAVQRLMVPLADSKGVRLQCMVDPQLQPWSRVDGLRLRQILFNLVGNALKFTAHGRVELVLLVLGTTERGQVLRLQVRDSGIGISPERQQAVFAPFAQAETSTARRFGGSGLGLSICRELAAAMGGQLQLHSTVGEGTTVWLDLRLDATPAPAASARRSGPALLSPTRVLLAEPDAAAREQVHGWLRAMGLQVQAVADGRHAWRAWQDAPFELLVSRWCLPGRQGTALVQAVRGSSNGLPLPIVVVAEPEAVVPRLAALAAGADVVLDAPLQRPLLQALLARLLAAAPGLPALAMRMGGADNARTLLASLIPCCGQDLHRLQQAWQQGDTATLQVTLHRLRGVLSMVGAPALAERLWALEQGTDAAALATAVDAVRDYLQRLQADAAQ